MQKLLHVLGRAALGAPFAYLGYQALAEPGGRTDKAASLGVPEPELAVRINGGAMVLGGAALTLGVLPRAAAAGLALSLVPTTLAGHAFWQESDDASKAGQRIHFMKNVGLAGALLAYAARGAHR